MTYSNIADVPCGPGLVRPRFTKEGVEDSAGNELHLA